MIQDIAPHALHNEFRLRMQIRPEDPVFHFSGDRLLVCEGTYAPVLPDRARLGALPDEAFLYLFTLDDTPYYLARQAEDISAAHLVYQSLRELRRICPPDEKALMFAVYTAYHLAGWYRDNRYCGRCGTLTVPAGDERALDCPSCRRRIYPRINPAVIVGVISKDRLLMTKYADRPLSMYALVAGFTEIGETLEETVQREVMEEVGLKVKNIRYYKSQPWGIADDILSGFYCDVDGDDTIRLDRNELKEGKWFAREDVIGQPDDFSLTNEMMMTFKAGQEPR